MEPGYLSFDPPLLKGDIVPIQTKITNAEPGSQLCLLVSLHDELLGECCAEEIKVTLPICDLECTDYALSTRIVACCADTLTGTITVTVTQTTIFELTASSGGGEGTATRTVAQSVGELLAPIGRKGAAYCDSGFMHLLSSAV